MLLDLISAWRFTNGKDHSHCLGPIVSAITPTILEANLAFRPPKGESLMSAIHEIPVKRDTSDQTGNLMSRLIPMAEPETAMRLKKYENKILVLFPAEETQLDSMCCSAAKIVSVMQTFGSVSLVEAPLSEGLQALLVAIADFLELIPSSRIKPAT